LTYEELFEWLEEAGYDDDYDYAVAMWTGRTNLTNIISREDYNNYFGLEQEEKSLYEAEKDGYVKEFLEPEPEPVFIYEAFDYSPLKDLEPLINWLFGEE
jgi:hypothetical protein